MQNTPRRQPRRKKKSHGALYAPLAFIAICAALILGMSVFFRVSRIEVEGNVRYTADEVIAASGIDKGDNLFFINRISAGSRITTRLPYVETASVDRALPDRVVITVTESQALAYLTAGDDYWIIDRSCKLLTQAEGTELAGLIRVDGLVPVDPTVGDVAAPETEDAPKVAYLAEILDQIQRRGMQDDITWIDISAAVDPTFDYLGRFTVRLGTQEDTEVKFGRLLSAVSLLTAGDTGTIDLSLDKKAHFSPG